MSDRPGRRRREEIESRSSDGTRKAESYEVRQERLRIQLDEDGFPIIKRPRKDNAPSATDASETQSRHSATSWRSYASSRRSKDSMSGGHVVPKLDDALKTGTVLYFQGSGKGTGTSSSASAAAAVLGLSNSNKNDKDKDDTITAEKGLDDEQFVERLASQIEEKTARELDRHWYAHDETGDVDVGHTSLFEDSFLELKGKEERYKRDQTHLAAKRRGGVWAQEQDLWELNRLTVAGLQKQEIDFSSFANLSDESRDLVVVKDETPNFLHGQQVDQVERGEVSVVKDPTSDLAVCAHRGSEVLQRLREETEKTKLKDRFWELAGTTLGKVLGVQDEKELADLQAEEEMQSMRPRSNLGASLTSGDGVTYSKKRLDEQRASLPVTKCREELMSLVRENAVCIIVGETGSGKTTQLTQFLLAEGFGRKRAVNENTRRMIHGSNEDAISDESAGEEESEIETASTTRYKYGMIGCTQPRRVAAVSVAKRVSEEYGCQLGREVGYSIRFEDCTSEVTRIKYMTDAFLLREILSDTELERYDAIVMDEAHERSLATDVLFGLLKQLVARRRDLKLLVTSATMNAERFSQFFGGAPIYNIPGRTFPVHVEFSRSAVRDYVDGSAQKCLQIHCSFPFDPKDPSDVLIFMTGQEDIEGLCIILSERAATLKDKMQPLSVLPIYSQLPSDLQAKVFERSQFRKVIVATNIAETSLTLSGVRFVIDAGFCKLKVYSPRIGMDTLQLTPISRANANQRSGRAGRTAPGICYRLYTENAFFSEMYDVQVPEIQRTNLANVVLLLKSLKVDDLLQFEFMDPPPAETILSAMFQLWLLGALNEEAHLTPLGAKMAHLPVDPSLSKMILLSDKLKCSDELVSIVALLSVPSLFYRPKGRADEADASREKFAVPESDHLTLLNVYNQWISNKCSPSWAGRHFIHQKALIKVRSVRDQLVDIVRGQRLTLVSCNQEWDVVRKTIASGYFHHAAKLRGLGEYVNLRTSVPCHLHPSSALFLSGLAPDYVVYHEVMVTTKEYMQNVTSIDATWLAELGPNIFTTRRAGGGS